MRSGLVSTGERFRLIHQAYELLLAQITYLPESQGLGNIGNCMLRVVQFVRKVRGHLRNICGVRWTYIIVGCSIDRSIRDSNVFYWRDMIRIIRPCFYIICFFFM